MVDCVENLLSDQQSQINKDENSQSNKSSIISKSILESHLQLKSGKSSTINMLSAAKISIPHSKICS